MTKTLQDLIDESIFISTEYQARLAEISSGSEWTVDFAAPSFTLQSDSSVTLTPYLLGTESENRGSWIWSWQELGHFPDTVVSAAIQAREAGAQHGISELTTDELVLSDGLARRLTLASKAVTGLYAHYPVTAGAGVRAWILVDGEALELEAPTVNRMGRVMAESLKNNTIVNQQRAVDSYARLRGAHIAWDTEATAVITATDGALRLWFDNGKISGIESAEPSVDSHELNRCAQHAAQLREKMTAERQEIERIAAAEAAQQIAAREAAHDAEVRERAEAEAQAQAKAQEAARLEAEAREQEDEKKEELPSTVATPQPETETVEDVEGVTTTDRVYPHAEQPYDQDPSENAEPGRVTTSGLSEEELVSESKESEDRYDSSAESETAAEQRYEEAEKLAQEDVEEELETERRRPSPFRVAGSAPDLEDERAEADTEKPVKEEKEKKGFFSRFFGL